MEQEDVGTERPELRATMEGESKGELKLASEKKGEEDVQFRIGEE